MGSRFSSARSPPRASAAALGAGRRRSGGCPRGPGRSSPRPSSVRVFLPHVFLGPSPLSFRLDPRWLDDLQRLTRLSSSVAGFPPALQWAGRTLFFPVENFVLWGAGVAFGLAAIAALVWTSSRSCAAARSALAPLTAHVLFLFLYHGLTLVKSIRYFYPAYPALAALTGVAFSSLAGPRALPPAGPRARRTASSAGTFLWARRLHVDLPAHRTRASRRRAGSTRTCRREARSATSPGTTGSRCPMPGTTPDGYAGPSLRALRPGHAARRSIELVNALSKSDWVAVTSGRVYMNVTRIPSVFPMSIAYYRALFDGQPRLRARRPTSRPIPRSGRCASPDDRAEEQFTVYDHPRVLLFRKTTALLAREAREALLLAAMPADAADDAGLGEVAARAAPGVGAGPSRSARRAGRVAGVVRAARPRGSLRRRARLVPRARCSSARSRAPLCWAAFPRLADRGLGFARILGLVLVTYLLTLGADVSASLANGRRAAVRLPRRSWPRALRRRLPAQPARLPPLPRREPPRPPAERGGLRRRIPPLPGHPRAQPRDLLGREADGLLDPEHPGAHPLAAALGSRGSPGRRSATTRSARRWSSS